MKFEKISFLFFMLLSANSFACIKVTVEPNKPFDLISKTSQIVYAKAISSERADSVPYALKPGTYHFQVVKLMKGKVDRQISVPGDLDESGLWDTTFSNHASDLFWSDMGGGRLGTIGDCVTTPAPVFVIGRSYLLFLNGPDDSRKFERVDNINDKWFQYVTLNIKDIP